MQLPNLAGVATSDLVEQIRGSGTFSASYINWSRTLNLLRQHAPGWLPEVVPNADGGLLHAAPIGCYMLIRFRNGDVTTPAVPQAVMDTRNGAIQHDKITARDVTDTHRRGVCLAAAMIFGLAYELWAKMPLESGHEPAPPPKGSAKDVLRDSFEAMQPEVQDQLRKQAHAINASTGEPPHLVSMVEDVLSEFQAEDRNDVKSALWYLLDSKIRSAIKRAATVA